MLYLIMRIIATFYEILSIILIILHYNYTTGYIILILKILAINLYTTYTYYKLYLILPI